MKQLESQTRGAGKQSLLIRFEKAMLLLLLAAFLFIPSASYSEGQEPEIRVKLPGSLSEVTLTSSQGIILYQMGQDDQLRQVKKVDAFKTVKVLANNKTLSISGSDEYYSGPILVRSQNTNPAEVPQIKVNRTWYRGEFMIHRNKGRSLLVVNHLPMDEYLKGVVAVEMPPEWPLEALKAQAVAARTYAYSQMKDPLGACYDICATQECQVYRGVTGETQSTNRAVDETFGEVATYQGAPIQAFFHSSAGGLTENSRDLLGTSVPYLASVKDFDEKSPHSVWEKRYSASALKEKLAERGIRVGSLMEVQVVSTTSTGRAKSVKIVGSQGTTFMSGLSFRNMLGLKSTFFTVMSAGKPVEEYLVEKASYSDENIFDDNRGRSFTIIGRGFGHGLGMSQWGARTMAQQGKTYDEILHHYYPNSLLENMGGSQ